LSISADAHSSSVLRRVLNHTYTAMASRLLRVNLLSPLTGKFPSPYPPKILFDKSCLVHSSIDARLDVVEGERNILIQLLVTKIDTTELINAEDRFTYVRDALKTLNKMDFDKLIVSVPNFYTHPIACFLQSFSLLHLKLALQLARSQLLSVFYKY
jgi:DNA mismatch repair protein MSH4